MAEPLQLPDGRHLDYIVSGVEDGFPLIFIHGTPESKVVFTDFDEICKAKGIKLITFSRAGYGNSSRSKGRRVVDVVPDLQALADHLGVKQCFVGGWSGGGPHSLACAARMPGCIAALSIAGVAPYDAEGLDFLEGQGQDNVEEFTFALQGEDALRKFCDTARIAMLEAGVEGLVQAMATLFPEADMNALRKNPTLSQFLDDGLREALKHNSDGWIDDDLAFTQPWGFELSEIKVPVLLYQGSEDKMVPFAHGKWLAAHLPQEKTKVALLPGEGHISIFNDYLDAMMDELLEIARKQ